MQKTKKLLSICLTLALALTLLPALPLTVYAASTATVIDFDTPNFFTTNASYANWSYDAASRTITVTDDVSVIGTVTGATQTLKFNIPASKTVKWSADYEGTGDSGSAYALIRLLGGIQGVFEVTGGTLANTDNASDGTAIYNGSSSATVSINGGTVSATSYMAIRNSFGTVNINGGTVSATSGRAIYNNGGTVNINGGTVSATSGSAINNNGGTATVSIGGGTVSATSGRAIHNGGGSVVGTVSINGGTVSATSGSAIYNGGGVGGSVSIGGGFVFAYGTGIGDVISVVSGSPTIIGGVVVAWDEAQNTTTYYEGTSADLVVNPVAGATATWHNHATLGGGIHYAYGANTGFFPIGGVTVNAATDYGLIFDAATGKLWLDIDGSGTVNTGDIEYTSGSGTTWTGAAGSLTLNGFSWSTPARIALTIVGGDTTISLTGTNGFISTFSGADTKTILTYGIKAGYTLTVGGTGTLNATGGTVTGGYGNSFGISGGLIINNGTVNATGGHSADNYSFGVVLTGNLTLNGGTLNAAGSPTANDSFGINGEGNENVTVNAGTLNATGGNDGYGLCLNAGNLTISGGAVEAIGDRRAFNKAPSALPTAYTYWTNATTTAPGGAGTLYYSGSGAAAYSYIWSDKYVKIAAGSVATVGDVTISGTQDTALVSSPAQTATLTLYGDTVATGGLSSANAASWFTGLPNGVTVTATASAGASTITLTLGGTPTAASTAAFAITIPASVLTGGAAITAQTNANAKFDIAAAYTVTYNLDGGTQQTGTWGGYTSGVGLTLPTAPTKTNYTFAGWYDNVGLAGSPVTAISTTDTGNKEFWAKWTTTYTLTVSAGSGGSVSGTASGDYAAGASVSVTATPNSGYRFTGWTASGVTLTSATANPAAFSMPAQAVTLTANFAANGGGWDYTPPNPTPTPTPVPGGSTVTTPPDNPPVNNPGGSVTLPGGGTITTPGGAEITVPPGTVIGNDGNITLPNGNTGADIHYGGNTVHVEPGMTIEIPDGDTPLGGFNVYWDNPFADVHEGDWFYNDVLYIYTHGLMNGTGATTFSPQMALTRGMIVTILYRHAGEPSVAGLSNPFSDVAAGQYYADAVKWAAANKIVEGYGNGIYAPNDPITREQLAAIIYRYAVFMGKGPVGAWLVNLPFEDKDKISGYATEAVTWCYMSGIVNGKPGNLFDPKGTATRAEVSAIVHRFAEAVK